MVTAHLLGQLVCSDRGMWPWALKASVGAESWRERCTVSAAAPTKPFPTGTAHLQPPGLFLLSTHNRYSIPIRATSGMDLLFPPCLLGVPAAVLGQGDSHQSPTQPCICAMAASGPWAVRREKQLIFSGESRGRELQITRKDASPHLWHKQVNLPHIMLSLEQEQGSWLCKVPSSPRPPPTTPSPY